MNHGQNLWEPPSGEIESLLFSLQVAIGAGAIGYIFGVLKERRKLLLIDKYAYTNRLRDYSPQVKILLACGSLVLLRSLDNNYLYILNIVFMLGLTLE